MQEIAASLVEVAASSQQAHLVAQTTAMSAIQQNHLTAHLRACDCSTAAPSSWCFVEESAVAYQLAAWLPQ